jgi:hypothetical protein
VEKYKKGYEVYGTRYMIFLSFGVSLRSLALNESEKFYKGLNTISLRPEGRSR